MHWLQGCRSDTLVNGFSILMIQFPCEHLHILLVDSFPQILPRGPLRTVITIILACCGSVADAVVYDDAHQSDLTVLAGKFYLIDAALWRMWHTPNSIPLDLLSSCWMGACSCQVCCFVSHNVCKIDDNVIGLSTEISSTTFDTLQHRMSLDGSSVSSKSTLWS